MKNVSNEYKAIAESLDGSARYYHQILVDGVELTDTIVEFKYSHTCNNSTNFSVGNTASAMVEFKIDEPSINLENKEIEVNQGLKLADGSMEYAKLGKFKVLSPEIERFQANYQCVDAMTYKMATVYESTLTYPTTDIAILEEICQQAGIELANTDLVAHTIDRKLDNYTKREIIGFIAQLQGKNAIINTDGKLEFIWYTQTDYVVDDNRIYSDRTDIIKNENDYVLGYIKSTYGSKEIVSGDIDTQGIRITNPYMTQDILDEVFNKIKGLTFRAINVDFYGDFRLEVGDIVTVNTNNESYVVPIMTLEQSSDGGVVTSIESIGETSTQNSVDTNGGILNEIKRSVVNSETARSIAEQSADKINFVVEGDSVSEFTITDKALNIIAKNIDLTGKVTFNSFDEETKDALSNISEPIKETEGSPILITDSAESNLIDFKAYGRSTQDGTPTPDAPIDIVSIGESGTLEIKSEGKNLYDVSLDTTRTNVGVTATINSNQTMTLSGTSTGAGALPSSSATKHKIKANIGDILTLSVKILSGNATIASNTSLAYMNVYVDGTILNNVAVGFINAPTNTVNSDTEITDTQYLVVTENMFSADGYIHIVSQTYVRSGDVYNDLVLVRQLEVNSVATEYEPYKSSTVSIPLAEPLRSVGEVRDEIACIDGVYGVIRRIGSKVFDGSSDEYWWKSSGNTVVDEFTLILEGFKTPTSKMVCTHFNYNASSNAIGTFRNYYSSAWSQPYQVFFMFSEYGTTTIDQFKQWLQSNPITIDYILANEVFEPFADQTPFYNIATFDSVTYITATDNAEMKVEYFRNTSTGQQLSNANSNANDAINKANEAMTQVNKTVKSITMHYLATTASSGVTTSTSGWTTTVQQINATKKYLWTYQTINYVDNTTTDTSPVISGVYGNTGNKGDKGDTGATGATGETGTGVSNVIPLYYLKSNTTAPSAPTSAVTSTSTASGVWTKSVPKYVNNYTYFTCTQTQYTNGTYGWSTVVADNALTNANKTATTANTNATTALNKANSVDSTLSSLCILEDNKTVIDGSKIYTGSVTAKQINVKDLFAQDITADGTITGVKLYGATGEFEGDIASYGTLTLYTGAINSDGKFVKDAGKIVLKATNRKNTASDDVIDVLLTFSSHIDDNNKTVLFLDNKNKLLLQHGDSNGDGSAIIQFGYDADASMGGTYYYEGGTKLLTKSEFAYKTLPGDTYNYEYIASPHIERLMADKLAVEDAYLENITTVNPLTVNASNFYALELKRLDSKYNVGIKFENKNGVLGHLVISTVDGKFQRMLGSDTSKVYDLIDSSGGALTGTLYYGADKSYYTNTSGLAVLNKINLDNAGGIFMKDSSGKLRTAVNLSASNVWSFATGGMEHSIVFGNNEKTNSMKIYGATIQIGDTANTTKILLNSAVSISGNVDLKSTEAKNITLQLTNSKRSGALSVSKDGHLGIWDSKFNNWMIYSDLNQNISIKGNTSVGGNMSPTVNSNASAGYSIGSPNFRWKYVYAYSSSIQTSDRRYKENIEYINNNDVLSKFFDALRPCTYFMAGGDRKHIGFIAQDVEQIMQDNGMTIDDLSFVCKDPEYKLLDESKPDSEDNREYLYDENGEPLYVYGLKYTELHGLEVNEIQKLKQRVNDLEFALSQALARIDALESKLS